MQSLASYLLLAVATALPHPQGDANSLASRGEANGLLARAGEEWTSDEVGANTNIGVSNDRIDWGDVKPWEVIMGLLDECHDNGCLPDAGVSQDTTVIATPGGKAADGTIVVTATGTFSKVEDEANLSTLVEVAALVFEELSEGENRVSSGVPYCTMNGQCQENGKFDTCSCCFYEPHRTMTPRLVSPFPSHHYLKPSIRLSIMRHFNLRLSLDRQAGKRSVQLHPRCYHYSEQGRRDPDGQPVHQCKG